MPNWKKIIVSGSDASLNSIQVTNAVTASEFTGSFTGSALLISASIGHLETIYETASVIYTSGSTKFGDTSDDTHERTGSLLVSGAVTAHSFNISSNAVGTPSIYSDSNINLSASNAVVITSSPLRLASFTNAQTGSITAQVGDIIYNSDTATYDLYSGSWLTILNETSTASLATTASHTAGTASIADLATTASHALNVPDTASHALTAITASHTAGTASIANTATTASHTAGTASIANLSTTASIADELSGLATASIADTATTASHVVTASFANNATTASHVVTASFADSSTTASISDELSQLATASHALTAVTASHAVSSSHVTEGDGVFSGSFSGSFQGDASQLNVNPFPFTGSGEMQGTLIVHSDNSYVDDYAESYFAGIAINSDGDMTVTGSIFSTYINANSFTGSLSGSATSASLAETASYFNGTVTSASFAESSSVTDLATTASHVVTASFADMATTASYGFDMTASSLRVEGTASIVYLESVYETASVIYSSGSTKFGDDTSDTHERTGSVDISGSLIVTGPSNLIASQSVNNNTSSGSLSFWQGSQAEYNAISNSADNNTVYFVV